MNFKHLVASVYLCITLAIATLPASAGQVARINPHQTTSLADTGNTTQAAARTDGSQAGMALLDTVWIFGFTVAGLFLLRKVQGE